MLKKCLFIVFLILSVLVFLYCDNNVEGEMCENYNYDDCNTIEPSTAFININVSCNSDFPLVPIVLYRGDIDDGVIVLYDTLNTTRKTYELPVNIYYSATAEYQYVSKKIYVLDGGKIKTKSEKICDSICWTRVNKELNLEVKDYFLNGD